MNADILNLGSQLFNQLSVLVSAMGSGMGLGGFIKEIGGPAAFGALVLLGYIFD